MLFVNLPRQGFLRLVTKDNQCADSRGGLVWRKQGIGLGYYRLVRQRVQTKANRVSENATFAVRAVAGK